MVVAPCETQHMLSTCNMNEFPWSSLTLAPVLPILGMVIFGIGYFIIG